jgi:hypothetical protein
LKESTASDIFRRLNSYSRQHNLYAALKLLVAGFPANRIRPKDLENAAFGSRHLSRSTVSFSWGRKWRNVRAGARFRPN